MKRRNFLAQSTLLGGGLLASLPALALGQSTILSSDEQQLLLEFRELLASYAEDEKAKGTHPSAVPVRILERGADTLCFLSASEEKITLSRRNGQLRAVLS